MEDRICSSWPLDGVLVLASPKARKYIRTVTVTKADIYADIVGHAVYGVYFPRRWTTAKIREELSFTLSSPPTILVGDLNCRLHRLTGSGTSSRETARDEMVTQACIGLGQG